MRKRKGKLIIKIVLLFMLSLAIVTGPIIFRGYDMYKEAISNQSIQEVVDRLKQDQDYVTIDEISPIYLEGVIESEDRRFYEHGAIDIISIMRAICIDIKEGRFAEGGSTITQQLAKNMYFSFEKTLERKVAEVLVAIQLEKHYTKDEILEMYCNVAYFGEGCYGLSEAANHYYQVTPLELSESQSQALILTLKSPNNYNPNMP